MAKPVNRPGGPIIPDRDHLSTVGDRCFKQAVLDFLAAHD